MKKACFEEVWDELKNENSESRFVFETAEEVSRIIVELIEARVDRGMSQRQLAAKCGLKQSAIARMEALNTIPRLDTVIRVAKALNISITVDRVTAKISGFSSGVYSGLVSSNGKYTWENNVPTYNEIGVSHGFVS